MEASQRPALKRRLTLLSVLLLVGIVTAAAILALGAEKAIPGTSKHYVSVVRRRQSTNQSSPQQAQFNELAKNLTAIATKDERVNALIAGKNYTVVGIAVARAPAVPPGDHPPDTAALFLKVDNKFYKIDIDIPHAKVTSVAERTCYGPACNG